MSAENVVICRGVQSEYGESNITIINKGQHVVEFIIIESPVSVSISNLIGIGRISIAVVSTTDCNQVTIAHCTFGIIIATGTTGQTGTVDVNFTILITVHLVTKTDSQAEIHYHVGNHFHRFSKTDKEGITTG